MEFQLSLAEKKRLYLSTWKTNRATVTSAAQIGGIAADIGKYLFTHTIRVEGVGRGVRRADGQWYMVGFRIRSFRELPSMSVRDAVQRFRDIPADWKKLADRLESFAALSKRERCRFQ